MIIIEGVLEIPTFMIIVGIVLAVAGLITYNSINNIYGIFSSILENKKQIIKLERELLKKKYGRK